MLNQQPLREHPHRGRAMRRQSFDRQKRLMLLRLHAGGVRNTFAEIQEAADFEAEIRERMIINGGSRVVLHYFSHVQLYYIV